MVVPDRQGDGNFRWTCSLSTVHHHRLVTMYKGEQGPKDYAWCKFPGKQREREAANNVHSRFFEFSNRFRFQLSSETFKRNQQLT